jgi:hypothetical protein
MNGYISGWPVPARLVERVERHHAVADRLDTPPREADGPAAHVVEQIEDCGAGIIAPANTKVPPQASIAGICSMPATWASGLTESRRS